MRFGYENYDAKSYQIGGIECFCRLVQGAEKKIALTGTYDADRVEEMRGLVQKMAEAHGIKCYEEYNLVKNNIAPDHYVQDKYVFLLYRDEADIEAYKALKEKERQIIEAGSYDEAAKKAITVELCRLLSYPEERIREKYM